MFHFENSGLTVSVGRSTCRIITALQTKASDIKRARERRFKVFKSLPNDFAHYVSRHIREPEVTAGVAVGQLFVVEAQQVKHGRAEGVDAGADLGGAGAGLYGRALSHAAADSPPP